MGLTSGGIRQEPLEMLPGETVVKIVSGGDHLVCLSNKGEIFTGGQYLKMLHKEFLFYYFIYIPLYVFIFLSVSNSFKKIF
jgi:hypothetical protein